MPDIRNTGIGVLLVVCLMLSGLLMRQHMVAASERVSHSDTKAAQAQQLQRLADASTKAAGAALLAKQQTDALVAAIDTQRTQELAHALDENERLRTVDVAGPGRLRIPAACPSRPASPPDLPGAATAPSVDSQAADIPAAFRQELWNLRAALITEQAQLLALQDYARACDTPKAPDAP